MNAGGGGGLGHRGLLAGAEEGGGRVDDRRAGAVFLSGAIGGLTRSGHRSMIVDRCRMTQHSSLDPAEVELKKESPMATLVRTTVPLDLAVYEQMSAGLKPVLVAAPGFCTHDVYGIDGAFVVTEVWDTAGDHAAFFDANVKANLPEGHTVEVHELASHVAA